MGRGEAQAMDRRIMKKHNTAGGETQMDSSDKAETQEQPDIACCFVCGRSMIYRGRRFCTERCREAFDDGFRPHDPNYVRSLARVPLGAWRIVAGPLDAKIGERCWDFVVDRPRRIKRRRKVSSGPLSTNSKLALKNRRNAMAYKAASGEGTSRNGNASSRSRRAA